MRKIVLYAVTLLLMFGCSGGGGGTNDPATTATLVSISVTPTNPSIALGTTKQFVATGTFSDNTTQDLAGAVTWNSNSTNIATISNANGSKGLATTVAAGSTVITAASGSVSGTTNLTVTPATLVSISVTPTNPSIALGTTKQFVATGTFSDNTTQDLTGAVTWNSNSIGIATISNANGSKGLATTVAAGSTVITAASGSVSGTTNLTVTPATLVSISVTPTNPSIALGTTKQFVATGTFSDNTTQDLTGAVTWNSNSIGIATISNANGSKGLATTVAAGSTLITATTSGVSGSTTLTVTPATLVSISVTPTNPSIALGTTKQFAATGTYSDNTTQDLTGAVTWNSNSTGIATISNANGSKGLATTVAAGSTVITAASGSVSGTTNLTVTPATLVSISVTPTNPSIALGTTKQFVATGTFSDNTTQDLTGAVTWNSNSIGIATISNANGSKGLATTVAAGSTVITAASGSVSGTTTLTILSWQIPGAVTRMDATTSNYCFSIFEGNGPSSTASVAEYSLLGKQLWKTKVLDYPGNLAGTSAMKCFADGTVSVIYTVEDPGSPHIGDRAGTITFVRLDANGVIIPGTEKIVDRGYPWSSTWDETNKCFYLIYSYKTGAGGDVIGKVDQQGNLVDWQAIQSNASSFGQVAVNQNGILLPGTVQNSFFAQGYASLHAQPWSITYQASVLSDIGILEASAVSGDSLFMGGLFNIFNGPQTGALLKLNTATGTADWVKYYPNEELVYFATDAAGNIYGFKKRTNKMFRIDADGTPVWEIPAPPVSAILLQGTKISVAGNGTVVFLDLNGNPL